MVRGIGIDIVEIERIENLINKYDLHFLEKVYTPREISFCRSKAFPAIHFSGRWAVKEAFYKALPSSLQPYSTWKSIEVLPEPGGGARPVITVVSPVLGELFMKEKITFCHLSLSHERSMCTAMVVMESAAE